MLVFIDESGDTGLKDLGGSSSRQFFVTMVVFEDHEQAQAADEHVGKLKQRLGLRKEFEFHFAKLKREWRELFLRELAQFEFFYFTVVLDKAELVKRGLDVPDALHRYTCGLVFEMAKPYLRDAIVILDGQASELVRRDLTSYLRKQMQDTGDAAPLIRKLKHQDSHKNHLLQVADIVCGAVARSFSGKPDATCYRSLISHREMEVKVWPK